MKLHNLFLRVLDSAGVPINADNSVELNFNFGSGPGGGEYLYPASVITNNLGQGPSDIEFRN